MLYQQSAAPDVRTLASSMPTPTSWTENATVVYKRLVEEKTSGQQAEIAALLISLTGHEVMAASIWADGVGRMAMAKLDGHTFCLRGEELTLLRKCTYCGVRSFDSPSIRTMEDLGRALAWEPCCEGCEPEDEDWSYSW